MPYNQNAKYEFMNRVGDMMVEWNFYISTINVCLKHAYNFFHPNYNFF